MTIAVEASGPGPVGAPVHGRRRETPAMAVDGQGALEVLKGFTSLLFVLLQSAHHPEVFQALQSSWRAAGPDLAAVVTGRLLELPA